MRNGFSGSESQFEKRAQLFPFFGFESLFRFVLMAMIQSSEYEICVWTATFDMVSALPLLRRHNDTAAFDIVSVRPPSS